MGKLKRKTRLNSSSRLLFSMLIMSLFFTTPLPAWTKEVPRIEFSPEEKTWLDKNHTVRVRVTDSAPYLYPKDGKPVGIAVDMINAVSERTGIKFHFVMPSPAFSTDLKGLIQHAGPDLIATLMPTPEREKNILFTKSYISSPRFIFTRDDAEFLSSTESLSGKTVAVIKDYVVHTDLAKDYPDINLLTCKNNKDALNAVSSGKAFAFIGDLIATPSMINEFGLKNLKAVAPSSLQDHSIAMGIRSDWPELRDIINKAMAAVPHEEKAAIINEWSTVKFEHGIRTADVLKWILVVVGAASGLLLFFVFWNRNLKKQVQERTGELERSTESLKTEISERKNAQNELRKGRDYLRNLTDSMGDAVFSTKMPERKIEWVNDYFRILGYDPKECIGKSTEFLYPNRKDFLAFGDTMAEFIAEGKNIFHTEQILRRKSGEVFPSEVTVTLFKEKNELVRATGIIRDITERKKREEEVKQSEENLARAQEIAHIGSWQLDIVKNELWWSDETYRIFGVAGRIPMTYEKFIAHVHPEEKAYVDERWLAALNKEPYDIEHRIMVAGEVKWVKENAELTFDEADKAVSAIGTVQDITERHQAEEALRESEEKFRTLVTHTEEIVYIIDKDGTFLLSEGKGLSKLGLKPGQVVGKSVFELYKDYPQMLAEIRKVFNGETLTTEANIGGIYFKTWYTPHKDYEGKIIGLLGLSINVSDQKKAETALEVYQQRLKALASQLTIAEEKERRRIASDLHDHVAQSLALARIQIASVLKLASDPRQTAILDDISDSLRQTIQETRDLIYDLSPPQLNEIGLFAAISEWLEEQVEKRYALKAECIVSGSEEPMDNDVSAILFRSVRELVTNVIKHARATRVNIKVNQDHDRVKIIVRDDGAGFDAISQSLKAEGGFGIFSIEEQMADLGGSLEIVSEPGQGTEAILAVPLMKEKDNEEIT